MKIISMQIENLDYLLEAFRIGVPLHNPRTMPNIFGENTKFLFSRISIYLTIENVSILEAYLLKIYSNDHLHISESYVDTDLTSDDALDKKIKQECQKMLDVIDTIESDTDINLKPGALLLPCGAVYKTVVVELTGATLFQVLTGIPEKVLIQEWGVDHTNIPKSLYETTYMMKIGPYIQEIFLDTFYAMSKTILARKDPTNDTFFVKNIYSVLDADNTFVKPRILTIPGVAEPLELPARTISEAAIDDMYAASDLITPVGGIHFFIEDNSLSKQISVLKEKKKSLSNKELSTLTRINVVINAPLYVFLEMALRLPNHMVIDHESFDFIRSFITGIYVQDEAEGYEVRIGNYINTLLELLIQKHQEDRDDLAKPRYQPENNWIPLNAKIGFSLSITFEEINTVIVAYRDEIRNGLYGETNTVLAKTIEILLSKIITDSKNLYTSILKN